MKTPEPPIIHTVGYTGLSTDRLVEVLVEAGVTRVVDVRELPLSRRAGFSKTPLSARLAEAGLDYTHLRPLGSPRDARKRFQSDRNWPVFATAVNDHLASSAATDALNHLVGLVSAERCCLLCTCPDPDRCHRSLVVEALGDKMAFRLVHLQPAERS